MLIRLGNVVYWFFCIAAAAFAVLALSGDSGSPNAPYIGLGVAFALWLTGRAAKYVLAGK
jgi:hypothetical protein